jgi:hypothetical protein
LKAKFGEDIATCNGWDCLNVEGEAWAAQASRRVRDRVEGFSVEAKETWYKLRDRRALSVEWAGQNWMTQKKYSHERTKHKGGRRLRRRRTS